MKLGDHTFSRRQLLVAILALIVLTGGSTAVLTGALWTTGSTFQTDSGLTVQVNSNQTLAGNPFSTNAFHGDGGDITATQTGTGYVEIDDWGTGTSDTIVSNISLTGTGATVTPDASAELGLNGTATKVSWNDITVDDGNTDFDATLASGDSLNVTIHGVVPDQNYKLVNASGGLVAIATANGDSTVDFEFSESGSYQVAEYDNGLPSVTNLDPDNQVVDDSVTLKATVDDDSLPGQNVTVTFRVDGSQVYTTTIDKKTRVTYTLTQSELPGAGSTSWSATAVDELGAETTESSNLFVPGNMTVRNVSDPDEVIPNASASIPNASATIYTENGTFSRDADQNGNISLTGLPANDLLVFVLNAPGYNERTMAVPSVMQAGDAYLIPKNESTVINRFTLNDPAGAFDNDAVVYIKRPITINGNTAYRTVAADQFGVNGFDVTLEEGQRYSITIIGVDGDVARMGKYSSTQNETVPLQPESAAVNLTDGETLGYSANVSNGDLHIDYLDPYNETEVLTVYVVNRFNSSDYLLKPQTYYGTNSLALTEPVGPNGLNDSYIVVIEGQRDGEDFTIRIPIGPEQINIVPGGLSPVWIQVGGISLVLLVGGVFSRLNVGVGAVVTSIFSGILWYLGMLGGVATWATIAIAITFSVVYAMVMQE